MKNKNTPDQQTSINARLNWLRASVLGANDGIVSIAALVSGVGAASNDQKTVVTAGVAGLIAGAFSMAAGEYVSVSSQRDSEKAFIEKEKQELLDHPEEELTELVDIYCAKGLSLKTARQVAIELTAQDSLKAHLDVQFNIDDEDLTNPWHAALASAISFVTGGIVPLATVAVINPAIKVPTTILSVVISLAILGALSGHFSQASKPKTMLRVIFGGLLAMAITYSAGKLFGATL